MALDWCKNMFFLSQNKWMNFEKSLYMHIYIYIYKMHAVSNAHYFWSTFNRLMAFDRRQNLFLLNILKINLWISIKFCICIDIEKM